MRMLYSTNEENYDNHSIQEAVESVVGDIEEFPETITVHVGEAVERALSDFMMVGQIIEDAQERAYDEAGEYSGGWLEDVTEEAKEELAEFIDKWSAKHKLKPHFCSIDNEEEILVEVLNEDGDYKVKQSEDC